jgi:hypothetical protein
MRIMPLAIMLILSLSMNLLCQEFFHEKALEYSSNEKCRFYRMAKRSATECAGILDVCYQLALIEDTRHAKSRALLLRIVAMLIRMAKLSENSGSGSHTGSGTKR